MRLKSFNIILLNLLVLALTIACKSIRSTEKYNTYDKIIFEETSCGSYKVTNNQQIIGYAVKPFIIEVNRQQKITEFERKLRIKFKNKFNKDYRAYSFTTDRAGDTILMTSFLSSKQIENIPKWKCELLEVDNYPKSSKWVVYNCSQSRFKAPSDPD